MLLDTTNNLFQIENFTNMSVILRDTTNAFSKYNLTITVEPTSVPLFSNQTKFYYNWSEAISVPIQVQSQNKVDAISWINNTAIQNLSYNKNTSLLNIQFLSTQKWKPVWVKLMSNDSWNRSMYYSNYWIYFYGYSPPAITNTFGPISVNRGEGKLFPLPSDLFTDPQNSTLELSVSNCIDKSHYFTDIKLSKRNKDEYYIFAQSNDTFTSWIFEIYATNSFNISNQYRTQLNIIQWASKDWVQWNGRFQSECTKWIRGYDIDDSGVWLISSSLFKLSQFIIFRILGIIVWILIIIQLLFCIKLKLLSFYSLFYMQTILVMIFSAENVSDGFTVFAYTLQWTKFDLSFMLFGIQKQFGCEQSSNKMMRLGFHCQNTIHNYMLLIILVIVMVVAIVGIKKYLAHTIIIQKLESFMTFIWNGSILSLILIPINISPFIIVNVIMDGINIGNQFILSLISIGAWSIILFILWLYSRFILSDNFINKVDPINTTCFFYLNVIRIIVLSLMFVLASNVFIYCIFTFILMTLQFSMTLIQFKDNKVLSDDLLKEKLVHRVVGAHMLFLMVIIWYANLYQTESIQKIWAFTVAEFYIFLLVVNFIIKLIKFKK